MGRTKPDHRGASIDMALPYPFDDPHRGDRADSAQARQASDDPDDFRPVPYGSNDPEHPKHQVILLRVAPWDVVATVLLLILLVVLATATSWPSKLYGFLGDVCADDTCGWVPLGID